MPADGHPGDMPSDSARRPAASRPASSARRKLAVAFLAGLAGGIAAAVAGAGRAAPLIGWDVLGVTYCVWVWCIVWRLDAHATANHANRENPGRDLADLILVGAAIASLIAVGMVLFGASHQRKSEIHRGRSRALLGLRVLDPDSHRSTRSNTRACTTPEPSEVPSTSTRTNDPEYSDFAYLSFTIGMTFQVSDTDLSESKTDPSRRTAARMAVLPARRRHHFRIDQPRGRAGEVSSRSV